MLSICPWPDELLRQSNIDKQLIVPCQCRTGNLANADKWKIAIAILVKINIQIQFLKSLIIKSRSVSHITFYTFAKWSMLKLPPIIETDQVRYHCNDTSGSWFDFRFLSDLHGVQYDLDKMAFHPFEFNPGGCTMSSFDRIDCKILTAQPVKCWIGEIRFWSFY